MKPLRNLLLGAALLGTGIAWAEGASAPAFGAADYVWNAVTPEQAAAMKLSGDVQRGREAYRGCRGCHRADGEGRSDGSYPRLSGQHAAVLVKEVTDTRAGVRRNAKMDPFASQHAVSLQEIVDIAEFLSRASAVTPNGRGDAALATLGARLYRERGCDDCHGADGAGQATRLYPLVAGQHYAYLLREMQLVQAGQRGNSHPDMVRTLRGLSLQDLQALASHLAALPAPRGGAR